MNALGRVRYLLAAESGARLGGADTVGIGPGWLRVASLGRRFLVCPSTPQVPRESSSSPEASPIVFQVKQSPIDY